MLKRIALTTILAGVSAVLVAQTPPPPPTPAEAAHQEQQEGASKQTYSNPTHQGTLNPEKQSQAPKDQRDNGSQETMNFWIIILTGVIALATIAQAIMAIYQARYMRYGLNISRDSANAARKSADAALNVLKRTEQTDRATVLIDTVRFNTETLIPATTILFTLKNFGHTTAHQVKFSGWFTGIGAMPIDETPPNSIAPQGTISWMSKSVSNWLQPTEIRIDQINCRQAELTYKIGITYEDSIRQYQCRCEGKYEPALKAFIITSSASD